MIIGRINNYHSICNGSHSNNEHVAKDCRCKERIHLKSEDTDRASGKRVFSANSVISGMEGNHHIFSAQSRRPRFVPSLEDSFEIANKTKSNKKTIKTPSPNDETLLASDKSNNSVASTLTTENIISEDNQQKSSSKIDFEDINKNINQKTSINKRKNDSISPKKVSEIKLLKNENEIQNISNTSEKMQDIKVDINNNIPKQPSTPILAKTTIDMNINEESKTSLIERQSKQSTVLLENSVDKTILTDSNKSGSINNPKNVSPKYPQKNQKENNNDPKKSIKREDSKISMNSGTIVTEKNSVVSSQSTDLNSKTNLIEKPSKPSTAVIEEKIKVEETIKNIPKQSNHSSSISTEPVSHKNSNLSSVKSSTINNETILNQNLTLSAPIVKITESYTSSIENDQRNSIKRESSSASGTFVSEKNSVASTKVTESDSQASVIKTPTSSLSRSTIQSDDNKSINEQRNSINQDNSQVSLISNPPIEVKSSKLISTQDMNRKTLIQKESTSTLSEKSEEPSESTISRGSSMTSSNSNPIQISTKSSALKSVITIETNPEKLLPKSSKTIPLNVASTNNDSKNSIKRENSQMISVSDKSSISINTSDLDSKTSLIEKLSKLPANSLENNGSKSILKDSNKIDSNVLSLKSPQKNQKENNNDSKHSIKREDSKISMNSGTIVTEKNSVVSSQSTDLNSKTSLIEKPSKPSTAVIEEKIKVEETIKNIPKQSSHSSSNLIQNLSADNQKQTTNQPIGNQINLIQKQSTISSVSSAASGLLESVKSLSKVIVDIPFETRSKKEKISESPVKQPKFTNSKSIPANLNDSYRNIEIQESQIIEENESMPENTGKNLNKKSKKKMSLSRSTSDSRLSYHSQKTNKPIQKKV